MMDKKLIVEKNPTVRWTVTELSSYIAEANPYFKNATPQVMTASAMSSVSIETGITINYDYNEVLSNSIISARVSAKGKTIKYKNK